MINRLSVAPPAPPNLPHNICSYYPNHCYLLHEPNYYDKNCFSNNDEYGGLGCNAGGLICCRFCEFNQYKDVPCIKSPSLPPLPPPSPLTPPSPSPPPSPPPPNNPLVLPIKDIVINPDKAKVHLHMRIQSTIESFNKRNFVKKFRKIFRHSISPDNILVFVRPGSLILDISVTTNVSIVDNTSYFMETFTPTLLSEELNMTVTEISEPEIIKYKENFFDYTEYIYLAIPISLLLFLITICFYKKYMKIKKQNLEKQIQISKEFNRLSGLESYRAKNIQEISTTKELIC